MSSVVMTKTFGKKLTNDQHFSQTSTQLSQRERDQIIERLIAILSENKLKAWVDIGLRDEYQRRHNHRLPDDWLIIVSECGPDVIEVETLSFSNCTKTLIKLPICKVKKEPSPATPPPKLATPTLPIHELMNVSLSPSKSVEPIVDNKSDEMLIDIKPSEDNSVPNETVNTRHNLNGASDQTKSVSIDFAANNGVNHCLESSNEAVKDVIYGGKPIPSPVLPPIKPWPINPEDFFDVVVLLAATPYNFIVVPFKNSEDKTSDFYELKCKMCEWYEKEENTIEVPPELFRKGLFVAAKSNNVWYRVEIITALSEDPFQVIGYLCDYGEHKTFSIEDIQPLYNCFRDLPMQAIRASLATVKPIGSDWDVITSVEFRKMVENKPFVATVFGIKMVDENPVLLLSLCDTSGADDVYVGPNLIQRNLAQPKPLVTSM